MARIADLNVSVGVLNNIEKGMKSAERSLRRSGARLSRLGSDITLSISAPLAGLGIAVVKSAGDMEALSNSLTSIMGDASAAGEEMEKLRKEALKPGLDFEQAIKGSVRLQAVGMDAEQARSALAAFGNALSLAGGTAQDLDGVTLALTQISAKGKVSAEEINQLAERVPQIRLAMKDAFGTADTEQLQKMGVQADKFINTVVKSLEKLPPAQTGIRNSMVNMFTAVRVAMADIGMEIDRTFDLKGKFEAVGQAVGDLAKWFKGLDDSTKKTIVSVGGFLVVLGPMVKLLGTINLMRAELIGMFAKMAGGLKNITGQTLAAAAAFKKMDLVSKATTIGLIVTALGLAAAAYSSFTNRVTEASVVQSAMNDVSSRAAQNMAAEKVQIEQLSKAVQDETKSEKERLAALNKLKAISPEYFGNLDIEKGKIHGINEAVGKYIALVQKRAKVAAAQEKLIEIEKKLLDVQQQVQDADPSIWQTLGNAITSAGNSMEFAKKQAKSLGANFAESQKHLEAQKAAMLEVIEAGADLGEGTNNMNGGIGGGGGGNGIKEAIDDMDALMAKFEQMDAQKAKAHKSYVLDVGLNGMGAMEQLPLPIPEGALESINAYEEAANRVSEMNQRVASSFEPLSDVFSFVQEGFVSMAQSMQTAAMEGVTSMQELGRAALKAAADFLRAQLMEAVAAVMTKTFKLTGPAGLFLAGAAGAATGVLFNKVLSNLKIPALAQGGLAFAPTMAMVGDNKGASVDPEVIAPLSKLKNMLGDVGGGGGNFIMSHRISGRDLLVIVEREQRLQGRTRGY